MIKRLLIATTLLITIIGGGYYFLYPQPLGVGAELPDAPALFETSLAAPITATADSFTLTSNTVSGGGSLSGYQCFTIDEGSAQAEFVCGTASGTAVTGVTRGISPSDGVSEVAALKFAHRRGASVKITDFPVIQIIRNQNNGEATFENALRYAGSVVPSSADDLADVGYVLSVVNGGTVNFDALVVSGTAGETLATSTLVYFATTTQRWFKVDTDSTATFQNVALGLTRGAGATAGSISGGGVLLKGLQTGLSGLTAGGTYHASSSAGDFNTATSVLPIGIAKSTTELMFDPVMLSIPRLGFNNTWTGTNSFSATTTFTGNVLGLYTRTVYSASTTYTKPANVKYIKVEAWGGGGSGGSDNSASSEVSGGGGGVYVEKIIDASQLSATTSIVIGVGGTAVSGNYGNSGGTTSFGSFVTAYGGGGGIIGGSGVFGGGGGCFFGTGLGGLDVDAGLPGSPGSIAVPLCGTGASTASSFGMYSGGGGNVTGSVRPGGNSVYGGSGGGSTGGSASSTAGTSIFGGNGGAALFGTGNATAGSVPGGGGGAKGSAGLTGNSGAGGNGQIIITEYF